MFEKTGTKESVPYYSRAIPQVWYTSNRIVWMENQGDLELVFPEFSDSKQVRLNLDIVCYDAQDPALMFGLIIKGFLSIVLDFKN